MIVLAHFGGGPISVVDRALRRAMFRIRGFAASIAIERGALDPPLRS
jgi:hypothetical protein